jgi:Glyoxalase/Bleomycin resistance protein/Dioxygenase superfamily
MTGRTGGRSAASGASSPHDGRARSVARTEPAAPLTAERCSLERMRLNHVTLGVSDVESSAAFYRRLGLEQIVADYPTYARFVAPNGDTTLSLHPLDRESSTPTASIHFEVDDVDATV